MAEHGRLGWRYKHEQKQPEVTEGLLDDAGHLIQLTKRLVERALETKMAEHPCRQHDTRIQNDEGNALNRINFVSHRSYETDPEVKWFRELCTSLMTNFRDES